MAWPPTTNINVTGLGYLGSQPATLAWGTDGLYSTAIILSQRSQQMIEEIKVENGNGVTATQVLINDGTQIEITVIDDRALTWPLSGTTITMLTPLPTGGAATSETLEVVDNSYQAARKAPGERTLLCKRYTLVTPASM